MTYIYNCKFTKRKKKNSHLNLSSEFETDLDNSPVRSFLVLSGVFGGPVGGLLSIGVVDFLGVSGLSIHSGVDRPLTVVSEEMKIT